MKIASAAIQFTSQHWAQQTHERRESLRAWVREGARENRLQGERVPPAAPPPPPRAAQEMDTENTAAALEDEPKIQLLIQVIERLTGKKLRFVSADDLKLADPNATEGARTSSPGEGAGWAVRYEAYERYSEEERTAFSAQGVVRTADGKEIAIDLDLTLSRRFVAEHHIRVEEGPARLKDPLVVNFSGTAAQLTQTRFAFDIDADGRQDAIPFVAPGSGFLALDANGDGTINDGRELFGALSGNGFADLAAHDSDGNGWIDENDPLYTRLRIWTKDADGRDRLLALGQAGVGALYLGSAATPFSLKDGANQLQGVVRSTGLFLREDRSAGTIQQLDLTA